MEIANEPEFLAAQAKIQELNWLRLAIIRTPVDTVKNFDELETKIDRLERDICDINYACAKYDSIHNAWRRGTWFPTSFGKRFWPLSPRADDFEISDISYALSRVNRFNGQTKFPGYTVAQHSVLVSLIIEPRFRLAGLLHDASEAFIHDVIRPVKKLIEPAYRPIEDAAMHVIGQKWGIDFKEPMTAYAIKRADETLLATEIRDVTWHRIHNGLLHEPSPLINIDRCWTPAEAETEFLRVFNEQVSI